MRKLHLLTHQWSAINNLDENVTQSKDLHLERITSLELSPSIAQRILTSVSIIKH